MAKSGVGLRRTFREDLLKQSEDESFFSAGRPNLKSARDKNVAVANFELLTSFFLSLLSECVCKWMVVRVCVRVRVQRESLLFTASIAF